jgi:hypothetical protein
LSPLIASLKGQKKGKKMSAKTNLDVLIDSSSPSFDEVRDGLTDAAGPIGKMSILCIKKLGGGSLDDLYTDEGSSKSLTGSAMLINAFLNIVLACTSGIHKF